MTCTPNISEFQSHYSFYSDYKAGFVSSVAPSCEQSPCSNDGRLLGVKWISVLWTAKPSNLTVPHILDYSTVMDLPTMVMSHWLGLCYDGYELQFLTVSVPWRLWGDVMGETTPKVFLFYAEDCKILLFGEVLSFDQLFQREDSRLLGKLTLVVWQERCLNSDGL